MAVALLEGVEHLHPHRRCQRGQAELVDPQTLQAGRGPLLRPPTLPRHEAGLAETPVPKVPTAQSDVKPGVGPTACDQAGRSGRQWLSHRVAPLLERDPQPVTAQVPFPGVELAHPGLVADPPPLTSDAVSGDHARFAGQRPVPKRRLVADHELVPIETAVGHRPLACVAHLSRGDHAGAGGHQAAGRGGHRVAWVAAEQPQLRVELAGPPLADGEEPCFEERHPRLVVEARFQAR